jgi:hypothetical protein
MMLAPAAQLDLQKKSLKGAEDPMKAHTQIFSVNWAGAMLLGMAILLIAGAAGAAEFDRTYASYDALLKRFVIDGRVDYKGIKADSGALDRFLDSSAGVSKGAFDAWGPSGQIAFLINLYNATTLKLIIDHYPVGSIKDIGSFFRGPWDQPVVRLFGNTITLDNLEHDILRKRYREPRIHMALVCAAKSCPPLRSEAYVASKLEAQLDDQSRRFLTGPTGLRIDRSGKAVYFSSIFKWYGKDFIAKYSPASGFSGLDKTERAIANFCSRYLSASDDDYLKAGGYSVKYLDYDWSLNTK